MPILEIINEVLSCLLFDSGWEIEMEIGLFLNWEFCECSSNAWCCFFFFCLQGHVLAVLSTCHPLCLGKVFCFTARAGLRAHHSPKAETLLLIWEASTNLSHLVLCSPNVAPSLLCFLFAQLYTKKLNAHSATAKHHLKTLLLLSATSLLVQFEWAQTEVRLRSSDNLLMRVSPGSSHTLTFQPASLLFLYSLWDI